MRKLDEQITAEQSSLDEQQEKLKTIIEKLSLFGNLSPQVSTSQTTEAFDQYYQISVSEDDIELAYLQEKQRRSQKTTALK